MEPLPFNYCYFQFRDPDGIAHELRVRVTPSLSLQFTLYCDNQEIGNVLDHKTNILIDSELAQALSYGNVLSTYMQILARKQ